MQLAETQSASLKGSPFDLQDHAAFMTWRQQKLASYPDSIEALTVKIHDGLHLSPEEFEQVVTCCKKANMAVYSLGSGDFSDKDLVRSLGTKFGLTRLDKNLRADEDAITALQQQERDGTRSYIPYTNQALSWHTDGYYNFLSQQVRGVVMHCVRPAQQGGENLLMDHEMVYLRLREENPDFIAALMQPDAMTIPANREDGAELRAEQTGPVFSVHPETGSLHMRYTARRRNIVWKQDAITRAAVECLRGLTDENADYAFRIRLQPGQGIICNNVLHGRSAFNDPESAAGQRLIYRARYYDRITGTGLGETN